MTHAKECFVHGTCTCPCMYHCCVFVSGYNNGMTVRNGVHHNPDKLRQLEVERLELGLYHLQEITLNSQSFYPFEFTCVITMSQGTILRFPSFCCMFAVHAMKINIQELCKTCPANSLCLGTTEPSNFVLWPFDS